MFQSKILMYVLITALTSSLGLLGKVGCDNSELKSELRSKSNAISKLEGTVKETKTAFSKRGIELENLKSDNEDLQRLVDERDEKIFATGEIALKWKDLYIKAKNTRQSIEPKKKVVDDKNTEVVVSQDCQTCLAENRIRVDFDHEEDPFLVKGFTLTSPSEAEIKIEWTRNLKLDLVLSRNDDRSFRLYIDPKSSDVEKAELTLQVDSSLFDLKWYEKIGIGADINGGPDGLVFCVRGYYQVRKDLYVGLNTVLLLDGFLVPRIFYGASIGWNPFREL